MLVHKVKAAEACRKVDFCKMKLSRCIQELKESGQWEEHCADLLGHAQRMNACTPTAEAPAAAELEMATPRSLGAAIASGAIRLGDGRPYGGHGNTWGEYREGHKIGSAAVAKVGVVTRANAKKASERLAEAGAGADRQQDPRGQRHQHDSRRDATPDTSGRGGCTARWQPPHHRRCERRGCDGSACTRCSCCHRTALGFRCSGQTLLSSGVATNAARACWGFVVGVCYTLLHSVGNRKCTAWVLIGACAPTDLTVCEVLRWLQSACQMQA